MAEELFKYKSHQRISMLPSCSLDFEFFKKLFSSLNDITKKAADLDIARLKKNPEQTEAEFDKLKEYARDLYKVTIQIFGSKGEYIVSDSSTIFSESNLPDSIDAIIFDNSMEFNFALKKEPRNKIKIEFDFRRPAIFSLFLTPSMATPNNSSINILGEDEMWVVAAQKTVADLIGKHKNKFGWLHRGFIYDLFLFILVLPLSFWSVFRIDQFIRLRELQVSSVFLVAFYIYFFILILNLFRLIFLWIKTAFPYVGLITPQKWRANVSRLGIIAIVLTIVFPIVYDACKFIWKLLFK